MARSKAQRAQAVANLAKMWSRRRNNGNEENEPPTEAAPQPDQEHVVRAPQAPQPHWNAVRARKENALKVNLEEQKLDATKRELRNTKRRERNLRKKNAELEAMEANHRANLVQVNISACLCAIGSIIDMCGR